MIVKYELQKYIRNRKSKGKFKYFEILIATLVHLIWGYSVLWAMWGSFTQKVNFWLKNLLKLYWMNITGNFNWRSLKHVLNISPFENLREMKCTKWV